MRTTSTIDDDIDRQLREIVHRSGKPFKIVVNEALRAGIENNRTADVGRPYRLEPVAMGEVTGPCNLHKTLQLADHLEDRGDEPHASAERVILIDMRTPLLQGPPGSFKASRPEAGPPRTPSR